MPWGYYCSTSPCWYFLIIFTVSENSLLLFVLFLGYGDWFHHQWVCYNWYQFFKLELFLRSLISIFTFSIPPKHHPNPPIQHSSPKTIFYSPSILFFFFQVPTAQLPMSWEAPLSPNTQYIILQLIYQYWSRKYLVYSKTTPHIFSVTGPKCCHNNCFSSTDRNTHLVLLLMVFCYEFELISMSFGSLVLCSIILWAALREMLSSLLLHLSYQIRFSELAHLFSIITSY